MNDFTKDELETLRNWGNVYYGFGYDDCCEAIGPLLNKIQAMIHNHPDNLKSSGKSFTERDWLQENHPDLFSDIECLMELYFNNRTAMK